MQKRFSILKQKTAGFLILCCYDDSVKSGIAKAVQWDFYFRVKPKHWAKWIASEHIIRVVPALQDVAGYNYIFLLSDYGRTLIQRYTYGAVIDEIDNGHVGDIPIPLLKNHDVQKKINDLALEANEKRYEAYKLEQKALEIMDKEVIYAK